jgi:hypothetical protein
VDQDAIVQFIWETFAGVDVVVGSKEAGDPELAWGDTFVSYDPAKDLPPDRRLPFVTIVTKDYGDFDRASKLDRPGIFRLNIGVGTEKYRALFGPHPAAPPSGEAVATGHDFAALDRIMPHPVYAPMSWVCVLNPSDAMFEKDVKPLLAEAYALVVRRRSPRSDEGDSA